MSNEERPHPIDPGTAGVLARLPDELMRILLNATADGIWEVDLLSRRVLWSQRLWRLLKRDPNMFALNMESFAAIIHPEDVQRWREAVRRRIAENFSPQIELRLQRGDGTYMPVLSRSAVVRDDAGRALRMVGTVLDMSERQAAVRALAESERRYRSLIESSPMAVLVHRDGRIVLANAACVRALGAEDEAQLEGTPVRARVHPDYVEQVQARIKLMQDGTERVGLADEVLLRMDGGSFVARVAATQIDFGGKQAVQVVFLDVTAEKEREQYGT